MHAKHHEQHILRPAASARAAAECCTSGGMEILQSQLHHCSALRLLTSLIPNPASARRTREEAERALNTMNGTFLGHRRIRCGWAQHKQDTSSCNFGCIDRADPTNANVYVGNVAADVRSQL